MKKLCLILVATVMLSGCTVPENTARDALEASGYTNVSLGGYSAFGCGEDDDFSRAFTATGTNGARVEGVVCSSVFKGATIRIQRVIATPRPAS